MASSSVKHFPAPILKYDFTPDEHRPLIEHGNDALWMCPAFQAQRMIRPHDSHNSCLFNKHWRPSSIPGTAMLGGPKTLASRSTFILLLKHALIYRGSPLDSRHNHQSYSSCGVKLIRYIILDLAPQARLSGQQLQGILPGQILLMFLVRKHLGQILVMIA